MKDLIGMLGALRRPRLLIRAARLAAQAYCRDRTLTRLLGYGDVPRTGQAIVKLVELEALLNDQRLLKDAAYSVSRHVEILAALVGEATALQRHAAADQPDGRL